MNFLEVCENQNIFTDISIESNISDAETYLRDICKEYNINYKTLEISPLEYVSEESIFDKIKNFVKTIFQKAIQFLIKIWKFITGLLKKAWEFFTNLIKKIMGNKHDKNREIEVKTGFIMVESASIQEKKLKSKDEIRDEYKKSLEKLSNKIRKLSQENINFMRRMETGIGNKIVKESIDILEEKVVYNDKKYHYNIDKIDIANKDVKDWFEIENKMDAVVQGKSFIEHQGKFDLKLLSTKKLKAIKKANTLTEGYNMLVESNLRDLISTFNNDPEGFNAKSDESFGFTIPSAMINSVVALQGKYEFSDIVKYIKNEFYPTFKGTKTEIEEQLNRWINLKINYNKSLINCLTEMVKNNSAIFNISMQEANIIASDLSNEDFSSVKKLIKTNVNQFLTFNGLCLDLRKVGLGTVVISDNSIWDWTQAYTKWAKALFEGEGVSDLAIQYLSKYDVTVLSHGAVNSDGKWVMDPVRTPNGSGPYDEMEEYLRKLISEGFKRINVVTCNPGGVKLSDDLVKNKKVLIQMSKKSTLIS